MRPYLTVIPLFISTIYCQSFTFPLSPNQPYPQYNNVFESRYPYIPNQHNSPSQGFQMNQGYPSMGQMNQIPMHNSIQQRFSFNPMTRIQVQPPMTNSFPSSSPRVTSQIGNSEYQVDQRIPLPTPSPSTQSLSPTRVIPPFLESASSSEQDKFYEIVQHPTWSGSEKNRRIEEFMKTMSEERQSMYSNFRRDVVDKELEEKRRNVDRAVSTMSKEAVDEFQRVVRIMHDPSQTEQEKLKKIEEIYSKLPDTIRKEFDVKLKGFK
uniref:DUF148 domain-containing protein n=1 Tax=Caenorhabditis tropicalis TaxID=1561998 RepID=A0A1I7U9X7_9PELO